MAIDSLRVPFEHEAVFPKGFFCVGVEPQLDFEKLGTADTQARDPNGERIWVATGWDADAVGKFGRSTEVKVKIAAPYQPVLPSSEVPGYPPLVVFIGLEATPWTDSQKCTGPRKGEPHKCRARLSWSFWAAGIADRVDFVSGGYAAEAAA